MVNQFLSSESAVDRFIPRRRGKDIELCNFLVNSSFQDDCKDSDGTKAEWQKKKYQQLLWASMFGCDQKSILTFSRSTENCNYGTIPNFLWPVKIRKKPIIGKPLTVLDIPGIQYESSYSIMDWNKNGDLACIHENEVYVWHANIHNAFQITNTHGRVKGSIKWNIAGSRLAMGLQRCQIAIWNVKHKKMEYIAFCRCKAVFCCVTSIVWTKKNQVISGCSSGTFAVWTSGLEMIAQISAHSESIVSLGLSCNENYLASCGEDHYVRIWDLRDFSDIINLCFSIPIMGVSWHPTKEPLIVFAVCDPDNIRYRSSLFLFNVTAENYSARKELPRGTFIDTLSFCPFSGELVVSYFRRNGTKYESEIAVHSDFDTKVDCMKFHTDRVVCLIWNKSTQQLGTAGVDENFCIWNFLGKPQIPSTGNTRSLRSNPFSIYRI